MQNSLTRPALLHKLERKGLKIYILFPHPILPTFAILFNVSTHRRPEVEPQVPLRLLEKWSLASSSSYSELVAPGIAFLIKEKIVTLSPGWPQLFGFLVGVGGGGGGVCVRCTRARDTCGLRKKKALLYFSCSAGEINFEFAFGQAVCVYVFVNRVT